MAIFSTNQARHLYVAKALGTVNEATGRMKETAAGTILPTVDADKAVKVGDKIEVVGKLKLYNSTPEIVSGTYTITQLDPVYNVKITSEHGTATATPASAVEGTEITLSVEVKTGWVFQSWTVTDASSNAIEVVDDKFTMPASDVTVVANYTESEAPDAVLKLSANGVVTSNTYKVGETVKLPETIENTCVKEFEDLINQKDVNRFLKFNEYAQRYYELKVELDSRESLITQNK